VFILDERDEVHILVPLDDEDSLAGVAVGMCCSRMSSRSPRSMWNTMSSKAIPRSALSLAFLASSQAKNFTQNSVAQCVPIRHTLASRGLCPKLCPDDPQIGPSETNAGDWKCEDLGRETRDRVGWDCCGWD
jgi:hypothetical protein